MTIKVYKVKDRFGDLKPRPEIGETVPKHADMLRYDLAFHDPNDLSRIIFPVFKTKYGMTTRHITIARWQSFSMSLAGFGAKEEYIEDWSKWITFRHPTSPQGGTDYHSLVPQTVSEFMTENKAKLAARHR